MTDTETNKFAIAIKKLAMETNLKYKEIAERAGIHPTQLSKYIAGTNEPSTHTLEKLISAFPSFSVVSGTFREIKEANETNGRRVPFYDVDVSAGSMTFFADNLETPTYQIMLPAFEDCEFVVPVYGHSMKPIINNGDQIACKEISERGFFNYGEVYLVVTNEQRMVKRLKKSKRIGNVILSSHNPDYDDIDIPIKKIIKLYIVKGIIKRNQL